MLEKKKKEKKKGGGRGAKFVNINGQQIIGDGGKWDTNIQNWTSELSDRSLLVASCNQYEMVVNFDNVWTEQTNMAHTETSS